MFGVVNFYTAIDPKQPHPMRGGIYWTCFQLPYTGPFVERIHRDARPIKRLDVNTFNPEREHPDPIDGTASNEFLALQKFKQRPVVIISTAGDPHVGDKSVWKTGAHTLVAPLLTIYDKTRKRYKCTSEFLVAALDYQYAGIFFLPGNTKFNLLPSIVRLDHAQPLHTSWLRKEGKGKKLSEDALRCIEEWLYYYVTGCVSPDFADNLKTYRKLIKEENLIDVSTSYSPEALYDN